MRTQLLALAFLGLVAVFVGGCSRPAVKADGSSTVNPITEAVAEEFRSDRPEVRVIVGRSGTGGGFKKFAAGEIDICNASRPISESERAACEEAGVEFVELEVALDGLAIVVNPANDWVDCLTVEQLKAIWQPDSAVSTWSDLDSQWPDEEIKLYGPGTDSGTFDYFTEVIVGKTASSRSDYMQSEDDNVLVTGVAGDKYSLGYFGLAYYEENKDELKLLEVDSGDGNCVAPSVETVREGTYKPLSRPLFIYVRKSSLERPEVRAFVKFYAGKVSDEELIRDVGYVPVPEDTVERNRQLLEDALAEEAPAA